MTAMDQIRWGFAYIKRVHGEAPEPRGLHVMPDIAPPAPSERPPGQLPADYDD